MSNSKCYIALAVILFGAWEVRRGSADVVACGLPVIGFPVGAGIGSAYRPAAQPASGIPAGEAAAGASQSSIQSIDDDAAGSNVRPAARAAGRTGMIWRMKRIFLQEGIPGELVWIAEVESAMNARARSRSGALGLFQLMPETAKRFGMRLGVFDERLNPEKSAHVAARYLKELHNQFGSWPLAIAAYNAGAGCVERLVRNMNATTFKEIASRLPGQTRSYVPRVIAIVSDREGVEAGFLPAPSSRES